MPKKSLAYDYAIIWWGSYEAANNSTILSPQKVANIIEVKQKDYEKMVGVWRHGYQNLAWWDICGLLSYLKGNIRSCFYSKEQKIILNLLFAWITS